MFHLLLDRVLPELERESGRQISASDVSFSFSLFFWNWGRVNLSLLAHRQQANTDGGSENPTSSTIVKYGGVIMRYNPTEPVEKVIRRRHLCLPALNFYHSCTVEMSLVSHSRYFILPMYLSACSLFSCNRANVHTPFRILSRNFDYRRSHLREMLLSQIAALRLNSSNTKQPQTMLFNGFPEQFSWLHL
jgi:hypothetical protein